MTSDDLEEYARRKDPRSRGGAERAADVRPEGPPPPPSRGQVLQEGLDHDGGTTGTTLGVSSRPEGDP